MLILPRVFEGRLAYELPSALEVQPQGLLEHHPQESEPLQVPRTLQRTDVYGPQAPVAYELRNRLLRLLVVTGDEHIERHDATPRSQGRTSENTYSTTLVNKGK